MQFIPRDLNQAQAHPNVILDFGKQLWKPLIAADCHFEILVWFRAQSRFCLDSLPRGTELGPLSELPASHVQPRFKRCWPRRWRLISTAPKGKALLQALIISLLVWVVLLVSARLIVRPMRSMRYNLRPRSFKCYLWNTSFPPEIPETQGSTFQRLLAACGERQEPSCSQRDVIYADKSNLS